MLALETPATGVAPAATDKAPTAGESADANVSPALSGIDLTSISLSGKDILLASSGDIHITSAYDLRQEDQRNAQATQVESFASQITQASHLAGDNITIAGANLAVDAGDLAAVGKVRMLASGNLSLGANTDRVDDYSLSIQSSSSFLKKKTRLDETHLQSATARPTSLSGAEVELQAGGDMTMYASQISASDKPVVLVAGCDCWRMRCWIRNNGWSAMSATAVSSGSLITIAPLKISRWRKRRQSLRCKAPIV